jgi:AraC-like DNA-binding protein
MNYQVHPASAELQLFIKCFWTLEADASPDPVKQRVVPDGCAEMIIHCGDLYRQYFPDGSFILQPRGFIFGQISNYIEIAPTGRSSIVAARFQPEGLAPFLEVPVSDLQDRANDLITLFGEAGKQLEEKIIAADGTTERIALLESFFLSRLSTPAAIDSITRNCVDIILRSQGQMEIKDLAGKANINRRNLERKFVTAIGMSPKQLSRVVRLQVTLKLLEQRKFTSLTSLAYENGYYDQAHFIRDFKEFTGTSPRLFFAENLRLAALFASAE